MLGARWAPDSVFSRYSRSAFLLDQTIGGNDFVPKKLFAALKLLHPVFQLLLLLLIRQSELRICFLFLVSRLE